jgi:hypothetical protein
MLGLSKVMPLLAFGASSPSFIEQKSQLIGMTKLGVALHVVGVLLIGLSLLFWAIRDEREAPVVRGAGVIAAALVLAIGLSNGWSGR